MSLILDALKKIEREKGEAGEKGVLVLGAVPWGETQARRTSLVIGATLGVLGVFALGAVATWWLLRPARPAGAALAEPVPAAPLPAGPLPAAPALTAPAAALTPAPATAVPAPAWAPATTPESAPSRAAAAATPPSSGAGLPSATPGPEGAAPVATPENPPAAAAPHVPAATNPEVRLTAISHRDGQPVALVNDRLVREGDSFDGIRILRIGDTEVEVEVRGQRRVIRF